MLRERREARSAWTLASAPGSLLGFGDPSEDHVREILAEVLAITHPAGIPTTHLGRGAPGWWSAASWC
jgi:hypothetical protein